MKTNKMVSFVAGLAMFATLGLACISAQAAVTEGIVFEMNSASTATERKVDLYYVGELAEIGDMCIVLKTDTSFESKPSFVSFMASDTANVSDPGSVEENNGVYWAKATSMISYEVANGKQYLGTLSFTVADTVEDVVLTVDVDDINNFVATCDWSDISTDSTYISENGYGYLQQPSSFTVVKELAKTKTIVAKKLEVANTYADEKVDAYTAAIESADADNTINWVLSNAEGKTFTKAANIGDKTAITGEATIVLGLKVFGENRTNVANVVVTVD